MSRFCKFGKLHVPNGSQTYISEYGTVTETIPATGHSWGAWSITTEPTKTETGAAERVCGNDSNHKDTMTLPKLTDNAVWTIGTYVAPTCENTGSQEYTSIYGTVTETIPATGHSWGAWSITIEPTKSEIGAAERVCGNDSSHKDNKTLPILSDASVWTKGAYVAPTCTEEGEQKYLSEYGVIIESLAALGHNYEWIITKQPTEEETGLKHEECSHCHDKKNETEIEKLPKTKFTITFDLNGGNNVSSKTLLTDSNGKLSDLPTASRTGNYRFDGWFTEATGGNEISVNTVFITDTKVYAHWTYTGGGGSSVTRYTVTFNTMGGSNIDSIRVKRNTVIQKPSDPIKDGYDFEGWYSDKNLTDKFDFDTKITKSITLYANWTEKEQPDKPAIIEPTHTGVAELLETEKHIKYMGGYDNGTFKPENNMTRAEAAQMFYNLLLKKDVSDNNTFDDVSTDAWYYDAVTTLSNMGIINGKGDGVFDPDGEITRAEFTTIAMRFTNIDINGTDNFTDVPSSHWASKNIADAVSLGWISGNGDGTFSPDRPITRASVSKIVNNMLGRKADMDYINNHNNSITLFPDVPVSAWYYADVVESTNTHEYDNNSGTEIWK